MDNLNPLLMERATKVEQLRNVVGGAETRGKITTDEQGKVDALTNEIRDLDARIGAIDGSRGTRGAELSAQSYAHGGDGNRDLGEWLAGETRALAEGTGGGQFIVPTDFLPSIWDRLRAESVGLRSGFSIIETQRDEVHIPKIDTDASSAWVAEGAQIAASDPGIAEVVANPRKLAALVAVTNEIVADSSPSVLRVVTDNLLKSLAAKLDLGFYEGSGAAPEIRGLKNVAGIQSVVTAANGVAPTSLDFFADAIGLLEQENANATAIVMHPRTWKSLMKLKENSTDSLKPLLSESAASPTGGVQRSLYGVPVFLTSALSIAEAQGTSNDASSVYVYDARQVVAVRRQEARVELDRSRLFNFDQSELRATLRWDLVVPNGKSVVRIAGFRP